ncbi:MAG TPA: hypothetical protein DEO66_11445 [Marinobacter adhaerens]|nr:hypothetical protein [Rhodopirellula sp.]HCA12331.1 hypothetical protein [Marinobacter adhaerens]
MAIPYITGLAALCIPHKGRIKPFWHSLRAPDTTWTVAGRNSPDTSWFFGERELVDVSEYFAQVDIKTDLVQCASYERAVFDLLYCHIEQNNRMVPNVQSSDIDDVVDFERIVAWILEWERSSQLKQGETMRGWLKSEDPWVEIQR